MIIVTGGAGFIGSNIVHGLNESGVKDIIVVDDLTQGIKFHNLVDCDIADYIDKNDFLDLIKDRSFLKNIKAISHQGACSDTMEWDGRYILQNNFEYSKQLLQACLSQNIPFIYASSAAVYGGGTCFKDEEGAHERPLNVYGYSKLLLDRYVRNCLPRATSQIVGLRYFNVYGPREAHKGTMASVAYHNQLQLQQSGVVRLFQGYAGYGDGEQRRDFVYVDDVVAVNLWFLQHPQRSGIFNVGTGSSQTFRELSEAVIDWHKRGEIEYIPFPDSLKGSYQSFTEADISALRAAGYQQPFRRVQEGVSAYLDWLASHNDSL